MIYEIAILSTSITFIYEQCRHRSGTTLHGISSGSTLFVNVLVYDFPVIKKKNKIKIEFAPKKIFSPVDQILF